MLGVQDVYALRHKVLVEGQSQRRVAREMGLARDTVRRYLATPVPEPQQQQRTRTRPVLERVGMTTPFGPLRCSRGLSSWHEGRSPPKGDTRPQNSGLDGPERLCGALTR